MFSCNIFRQGGVVVRRASGERIQVWFTLMRFGRLIKFFFPHHDLLVQGACEENGRSASSVLSQLKPTVAPFECLIWKDWFYPCILWGSLYCDLSVCGKTWSLRCIGFYYGSILYWQDSLEIVVKLKISYLSKTYLFKEEISIKSNFLELKFRSISCDLWTYTRFQVLKSARCIVYRTWASVCVYV